MSHISWQEARDILLPQRLRTHLLPCLSLEGILAKQDEACGKGIECLALLLRHLFLCRFHHLTHDGPLDWQWVRGGHQCLQDLVHGDGDDRPLDNSTSMEVNGRTLT